MALPKPDWKDWIKRPKVAYWEAIALARDVEPYAVTYWLEAKNRYWFGDEQRGSSWDSESTGRPKEQRRWLETLIAVASHKETCPFQTFYPVIDHRSDILLTEFAAFAVNQMQWPVPAALAELAKTPLKPSPNGKWPWGNHTTKNLEHLEAAAQEWWAKWDGTPRAAPTNEDVINWLVDERIASILRPSVDVLPTGNRPPGKSRKG
jgi:hypothetical protein